MKHFLKRTALVAALLTFTALPAMAQPIEREVLPPVQIAPQPAPSSSGTAPAPITAPAQKSSSGYLPMQSATPADAPLAPIGDTRPKSDIPDPASTSAGVNDNGMAGTSGGTSAYDLGKPANIAPADIAPAAAQPATNTHADPLLRDATPIRNWQENQDKSTRGDDPALASKKFCNLKVSFTSIGIGIDSKTAEKIKMYLVGNPDILTFTEHKWGREGEFDYCVSIPQHKNRAKIYSDLKRNLPPKAAKVSPTNIMGDGFEPVSTYH